MWGSWLMTVAQGMPPESWRNFQCDTFEIAMRYLLPGVQPQANIEPQANVQLQVLPQVPVQTQTQYHHQYPAQSYVSMLSGTALPQQQAAAYIKPAVQQQQQAPPRASLAPTSTASVWQGPGSSPSIIAQAYNALGSPSSGLIPSPLLGTSSPKGSDRLRTSFQLGDSLGEFSSRESSYTQPQPTAGSSDMTDL